MSAAAPDRPVASKRLVVNADDYGYFDGVSRGILAGIDAGVIRATGVMATSPHLDRHLPWLLERPAVDAGVHLDLSHGEPLSRSMARVLGRWGGRFPGKFRVAWGVASGELAGALVEEEWRAQIGRCQEAGLELWFINSHEHLHMLPQLWDRYLGLAFEMAIPFVRDTAPEWRGGWGAGALVRNLGLQLGRLGRRAPVPPHTPRMIGLAASGRLGPGYLGRALAGLAGGGSYELMCHPGHLDAGEVDDPRLLAYHRWEQELEVLVDGGLEGLCAAHGADIVGYRDLPRPGPGGAAPGRAS